MKEQPMPTDRERFIAADLIPDPTTPRVRFLGAHGVEDEEGAA